MPMIGQPTMATHSISRATLRPNISPTVPWNTVWSWLNTPTGRPLMVPWPVTTPSPKSALGSPGVLASAPISKKLPGSSSAWMRARALGMPFLSRLATAFSPPGSLASSSFSRSSASFSAVVCGCRGGGSFASCRLSVFSLRSGCWLIASLMCAPTFAMYGSSMAWMCSPPMGTTSRSATNSPQPPSGLRMA